jgi:lysine-N-methylase
MMAPRYVQAFTCIGSACPDTCCSGWGVPVDRETYQSWQTIQVHIAGSSLVERTRAARDDEELGAGNSAILAQTPSGDCTWLTDEKLCAIQARLGESALPLTCHSFPRRQVRAGDRVSMYLVLGCPEAARLALSDPAAMDMVPFPRPASERPPPTRERKFTGLATAAERADFTLDAIDAAAEPLADAARSLIGTPSLTVWQASALYWRMVSEIVAPENDSTEKAVVIEKIMALRQIAKHGGQLLPAAQAAEAFVLQLRPPPVMLQTARVVASRLQINNQQRPTRADALTQILSAFEPDGGSDASSADAACGVYLQALQQWFEPFDTAHPHLLKNVLLYRLGSRNFPSSGMSGILNEFAAESLHLEMLRVFLVGRAHARQEAFGIDDYVEVVQAYTRYVSLAH